VTVVQARDTTLTGLHGIGTLLAGKILALVGCIDRFRSAAAFAFPPPPPRSRPLPARSSATGFPGPASPAQSLSAHHGDYPAQPRHPGLGVLPGQNAPRAKSHREALRCLKRRLSDAVYRRLVRDAHPDTATGPGGHPGATTKSSAAGSTPTTDSSDQSLPGPAGTNPTNPPQRSTWPERRQRGLLRCAESEQSRLLIEVGQITRASSSKAARTRRFTVSSAPSS